jgi:hypothetical protein
VQRQDRQQRALLGGAERDDLVAELELDQAQETDGGATSVRRGPPTLSGA